MKTLLKKQNSQDMEVVIAELERSLVVLETNYQKAVSNLAVLRQCVETDDLTRLLRRGAFMKKLHNLLRSTNGRQEVHIMMIDVDHFKRVNDTYGHQTGDIVLERVSDLIRSYLRPQDLVGRYGGEEIIVAIQASSAEAMQVAENIRRAVQLHRMNSAVKAEVAFTVTLSVGIASSHIFKQVAKLEADVLVQNLIREADAALYRAKNNGRNRVIQATADHPVEFNLEQGQRAIAA